MTNRNTTLVSLFLLVCSLFPHTIFSQNQDERDQQVYQLFDISLEDILNVDIISATKQKQGVLDAPAQAFIVTKEQIQNRGYLSLVDVIDDLPQMSFLRNSDPENRNVVSMRGVVGNEKLLILQNGIRITPATGDFYTLGSNFSILHADKIEILIGPASALYGVDAFGGIINIITPVQGTGNTPLANIQSQVGNYGTTNYSFGANIGNRDLSLTISGFLTSSDEPDYQNIYPDQYLWYNNRFKPYGHVLLGPDEPDIHYIRQFEYEAGTSFNGNSVSQDFNIASKARNLFTEVSLKDFKFGFNHSLERHSTSYGIDPKYTAYDKDAWVESSQNVIYGSHNYNSFDERVNLSTTLSLNFFEINPNSNFVNINSFWQRGYIYSYSNSGKFEQQLNWQVNPEFTVSGGLSYEQHSSLPRSALSPIPYSDDLTLGEQEMFYIGGAGYEPLVYDRSLPTGVGRDISSVNEVPLVFQDSLLIPQTFYFTRFNNLGSYLQGIWSPTKSVSFIVGGRYDKNSRYGASFNPRLGMVLKPTSKMTLKMVYAESFLSPSPSKAFKQSGSFQGLFETEVNGENVGKVLFANTFHFPNPDLKPEKLKTFDIGYNTFIGNDFSFRINYFTTTITNTINLFSGNTSNIAASNDFIAETQQTSNNEGTMKLSGVSLGLSHFEEIGNIQFTTFINYDRTNGKITSNNEEVTHLAFHPQNMIKGGLDFGWNRLFISPRFVSYGEMKTREDAIISYESPAYTNLKLNIRYRISENSKWSLDGNIRIDNLLDTRHNNVSHLRSEGMAFTPQDPLMWLIGLKIIAK